MRALIFGINGQDGYYLTSLLLKQNIEVIGVSRTSKNWIIGDVSNRQFVEGLIKDNKPEYIFHLAANSTTNLDFIFENHETIATGTLNILNSVYKFSGKSKVFISGSGLQFKNTGLPISEENQFKASDGYSISRIQSVHAARYFRSLGVKAYVGYFFHHDSPMRSERHLNMRIVKQVQKISRGENIKLPIGDISVVKEFNFAGDLMDAVWILMNQEQIYEVVVGCGKGYKILDWLNICFGMINKKWENFVEISDYKPAFYSLVSNPALLCSLGWEPKHSIDSLARLMMRS